MPGLAHTPRSAASLPGHHACLISAWTLLWPNKGLHVIIRACWSDALHLRRQGAPDFEHGAMLLGKLLLQIVGALGLDEVQVADQEARGQA